MAWQPNLPYVTPAELLNPIGETLVNKSSTAKVNASMCLFVPLEAQKRHQTDRLLLKTPQRLKRGSDRTLLRRAVSKLAGQHMRY